MSRKITSRPFGDITIDEELIISFPEGLFGFDDVKSYILLEEENSPMRWLQSVEQQDLAFVMLRILEFMDEYDLAVPMSDLEALGVMEPSTLDVYAIITIPPSNPSDMTANLMGPVMINPKLKIGRQVISLSDKYKTKHRVLDELRKGKDAQREKEGA